MSCVDSMSSFVLETLYSVNLRSRYSHAYGRAILTPLSPNAILLTRGDLVTNSVRYLQECEGLRPDVIVLDMALMTYRWYVPAMKRAFGRLETVPSNRHPVIFPGTVLGEGREGFSIADFVDANMRAGRDVFISEKISNSMEGSSAGLFVRVKLHDFLN